MSINRISAPSSAGPTFSGNNHRKRSFNTSDDSFNLPGTPQTLPDSFIPSKRQKMEPPKHFEDGPLDDEDLKDKGIDTDDSDDEGVCRSDLHNAAVLGDTKAVRELLQGADREYLNERDEDGNTPLHLAAMEGHLPVVKALLNKGGIDTSAENNDGETANDLAAAQGFTDITKMLSQKMGIRHAVPMNTGGIFFSDGFRTD